MLESFGRLLTRLLSMLGLSILVGWSDASLADTIENFKNSWQGRTLAKQRLLDIYSPMADNNIPGTHNTYNSEAYTSCNFSVGCRYLDPQQKYSIYDQLRMGARFIEIDVHWTVKMEGIFSYPKRLLMCHGFCSINDKYLKEGLAEIRNWLNSSDSDNQVIILYFEDHMDGHHQDAYNQVNSYFGDWVYASQGCGNISSQLTKADVIAAGKKVVIWGDGGCSSNSSWKNMVFTGLGDIGRIWEDRTTIGAIGDIFTGGSDDYIDAQDVTNYFAQGANIVNLDDMVTDDGRLQAGIWSWDNNEPNNWGGNQDCALQWGNGRWDDQNCDNIYAFACENASNGEWAVTQDVGTWQQGESYCQALGNSYHFSVPTNSYHNQQLKQAKETKGFSNVWLNHDDRNSEGQWNVRGQSTHFIEPQYATSLSANKGQLTLLTGQAITTHNRYLVMQHDGNLVLYRFSNGRVAEPLWATGTNWGSQHRAIFQGDGNLVVYDQYGNALWASHTHGSGNRLILQGDGNLVIYNATGGAVWASNTHQ
ncbi:phosphatidylinositol-specific phospholipase C domain-containing protein [Aliikangiella sp. G2MR2-5]|uniref:phosphatidylinositol-specific phospholipase C domain-containing protein n=1 Tax=Aliikangiella sp. G2MR2-5 TaxID=2788943 RepID=UPI0018AA2D94|nr:phosphatidylinositol-specific phospholipase C domain-containing protein [Aliikangiella sp. G2MR2-5]